MIYKRTFFNFLMKFSKSSQPKKLVKYKRTCIGVSEEKL